MLLSFHPTRRSSFVKERKQWLVCMGVQVGGTLQNGSLGPWKRPIMWSNRSSQDRIGGGGARKAWRTAAFRHLEVRTRGQGVCDFISNPRSLILWGWMSPVCSSGIVLFYFLSDLALQPLESNSFMMFWQQYDLPNVTVRDGIWVRVKLPHTVFFFSQSQVSQDSQLVDWLPKIRGGV